MFRETDKIGREIDALVDGLVLVCSKKYGSWPFIDDGYLNPVILEENDYDRQNIFHSGIATFYATQDRAKLFLHDSGECATISREVLNSIDHTQARNCFSKTDSFEPIFTAALLLDNTTPPSVIRALNSIEQLSRAFGRDAICDQVRAAMEIKKYNHFARVWKLPFGCSYISGPQADTPARQYLSRNDFKEVYQLLSIMKRE